MVQVLPYVPSFGESLAPIAAQAGVNVFQAFQEQRAKKNDERIINSFDPNDSPINQIQKFSQLSPQRQQTIAPLLQQLMKTQGAQQVQNQKASIKQQETQAKEAKEKAEKEEATAGLKSALDWLDENQTYAGSSTIPFTKSFTAGGLNREAVGKRAEIDATGFWAADQVFTHFNKGTVSKEKLAVIQKDLAPRSGISEREYKARVSALRRMSNLPADISKEEFNKQLAKEVKNAKSGKGGEESSSAKTWVISPNGKRVQIPSDQVQAALANGGTLG